MRLQPKLRCGAGDPQMYAVRALAVSNEIRKKFSDKISLSVIKCPQTSFHIACNFLALIKEYGRDASNAVKKTRLPFI